MKEALAERLLGKLMGWPQQKVAEERPILQTLAEYKYDEYQQFSTGMHFIESTANWLGNFELQEEREAAYRFVTERLLFISEAEMRHLVSLAYYDYIRPILLSKTAVALGKPDYLVSFVASSNEFEEAERESLFLGLSDGARIDVLRRMSSLNNEQVHATYQVTAEKAADMLRELRTDFEVRGRAVEEPVTFKTLFLMNDFAGSGDSLLRDENGQFEGKLPRCLETLKNAGLVSIESADIHIIIYVSTKKALDVIKDRLSKFNLVHKTECKIAAVHVLDDNIKVSQEHDSEFDKLLVKYYDSQIMDKHLMKGGPDVIHGYAGCSLPLILTHNTPNNSVYLLWANKPGLRTRALFPRVSRHREEI